MLISVLTFHLVRSVSPPVEFSASHRLSSHFAFFSPYRSPGSFSASSLRPTLSSTRRKCLPCFKVGVFTADGPYCIVIYSVSLRLIYRPLIFFPSNSIRLMDCRMINMQRDFKVSTQRFFADYVVLPPTLIDHLCRTCAAFCHCASSMEHLHSGDMLFFWGES